MRCNNCGWPNPEGATKCQKCNQPLFSEDIIPEQEEGLATEPNSVHPSSPAEDQQSKIEPNKTVPLSSFTGQVPSEEPKQESAPLPRRTVFIYGPGNSTYTKDASALVKKARDLRSTLVDVEVEDLDSMCETVMSSVKTEEIVKETIIQEKEQLADTEPSKGEQENRYELSCMDGESSISLISSCPLDVKSGDIILISGLRFKAN